MITSETHKKIGQLIKEEVERQGLSAKKFGEMIWYDGHVIHLW